jgi:hypothetical protein
MPEQDDLIPIHLTFEVRAMRGTIARMLSTRQLEIEKHVNAQIENFLKTYDFGLAIRTMMGDIMNRSVKDALEKHFLYGPGAAEIKAELGKFLLTSGKVKLQKKK